jgi:hypothetical protein
MAYNNLMYVHYIVTEHMAQQKKQAPKDNTHRKQIRFGTLLAEIDKARKDEALAVWVKQACRERLEREKR